MDSLRQDLRYAFRTFAREPGFSLLVVAILAFGIGVNTAIFSIVNAVLLRPLPFPDADRLIQIKKDLPRFGPNPLVFLPELRNWQRGSRSFSQIEGYQFETANLTGGSEAERVSFGRVTGGFFRMLGIVPLKGRDFLPEEELAGGQPAALLSEGLWKSRFGGDAGVLGKTVTLDGKVYTVIGIIPSSFQFPSRYGEPVDLWATFASVGAESKYGMPVLAEALGRLKPGVPARDAANELDTISRAAPKSRARDKTLPVPWQEAIVGDLKVRLLIFLGAVGAVLLIACANIANLLLSRAAVREKEMAVRASLGADRPRMFRQLLTESLVLSVSGGVAGLVLAFWTVRLLFIALTDRLHGARGAALDLRVLAFTAALAVISGVLFGLVPALRSSRVNLVESLKEGGRGTRGTRHHRLSDALVTAEVAIALVLLVGAGLLVRSMLRLYRVDPGFRTDKILVMTIDLTPSKYPKPGDQARYFREVIERIRALPGVQSIAASACVPFGQFSMSASGIEIEGRPDKDELRPQPISVDVVSPDYFQTMNIPLRAGRIFSEADGEGAPGVGVVSEAFVRRYFPSENPIGKRLKSPFQRNQWISVIGVVGDVHQEGLERQARAQIYRCYLQAGTQFMALISQVSADPRKMASAIRNQAMSVDRDQPVFGIATLDDLLDRSLIPRKTNLALMGVFALFALTLAAVGIFGVVTYNVSGRTHEIGVRMALGARPLNVVAMIVGKSLVHVLAGVVVGLAAASGLSRYLSSLLFEITALDPVTFCVIPLLLILSALAASSLPSVRATRVDPVDALRCE